jgi:hypothetical protein
VNHAHRATLFNDQAPSGPERHPARRSLNSVQCSADSCRARGAHHAPPPQDEPLAAGMVEALPAEPGPRQAPIAAGAPSKAAPPDGQGMRNQPPLMRGSVERRRGNDGESSSDGARGEGGGASRYVFRRGFNGTHHCSSAIQSPGQGRVPSFASEAMARASTRMALSATGGGARRDASKRSAVGWRRRRPVVGCR